MKTKKNTNALIAYVATALFAFSIMGLIIMKDSNKKMERALNESLLNAESLLSEKLSVEKQIDQLKRDISQLNGKNKDLDKVLNETSKKLTQKENQFKALVNSSNTKARSLEDQISELNKIKADLEKEKQSLAQNLNQIKNENKDLNNLIASLQEKNKKNQDDIHLLRTVADNFKIESLKGKKDRLTVNSRRTNKLALGFDVPQKLTEDINFKITTPQGKTVASKDSKTKSAISMRMVESDQGLVASLSPMSGDFEVSKRIEMSYKPNEKLKPGIYKIQVYNGDEYLGSCQVRLK